MGKSKKYTYCIFYLENKLWQNLPTQLEDAGYSNIKAIIPTVKILKKTSKGKMIFDEVPVLFNFGFMKMPTELAYSRPFLNTMRKKLPGLHAWLRDTIAMHQKKSKRRIDNAEDWDDFSKVATCSAQDVRRFKRIAKKNKQFALDDLVNIKKGDYVTLKGYPYEGQGATVLDVNYASRTITVNLVILNGYMKLTLPFDNILYSVYMNYDPDILYAPFMDKDLSSITEDQTYSIFNKVY